MGWLLVRNEWINSLGLNVKGNYLKSNRIFQQHSRLFCGNQQILLQKNRDVAEKLSTYYCSEVDDY